MLGRGVHALYYCSHWSFLGACVLRINCAVDENNWAYDRAKLWSVPRNRTTRPLNADLADHPTPTSRLPLVLILKIYAHYIYWVQFTVRVTINGGTTHTTSAYSDNMSRTAKVILKHRPPTKMSPTERETAWYLLTFSRISVCQAVEQVGSRFCGQGIWCWGCDDFV